MFHRWVNLVALVSAVLWGQSALYAWHIDGCVFCDANGNGAIDGDDIPLAGIEIVVTDTNSGATYSGLTGADGCYSFNLPDEPASYSAAVVMGDLPGDSTVVIPAGGTYVFSLDPVAHSLEGADFLIDSSICREDEGACWMTGGGVKFESVPDMWMAQGGPKDSMGGVVFPSCSGDPGDGGNWNHVAHSQKLHFRGHTIHTVRCGNVDDPDVEPGSESPVTPFNFIEFEGVGLLDGIKGNRVDHGTVHFFGRVEDRNEPGSNGAKDGIDIDRYFLHVFSDPGDPAGSTLLLIDQDGDPTTVDPLLISGGNLQLHSTSCDGDGGAASLQVQPGAYFLRGDANTDGSMDISDPVFTLTHLFLGGPEPRCFDAADANDDGQMNLSDSIFSLSALFTGGSPGSLLDEPEIDLTADELTCVMAPR